jgi:ABC-type antimicrobial peptide transport system permease subunit
MKIVDLLAMSLANLWKRKIRTALTVLGVVIGVTSIVVMVALGNGLKESMLESFSSYYSMTQINVNTGGYYSGSSEDEDKRLDDELVSELAGMEHVVAVYPRLNFDVLAKYGKYIGDVRLVGLTKGEFDTFDIEVEQGRSFDPDSSELELFYGSNVLMYFYVEKTYDYPYFSKGVLPDIDVLNDNIFYIFDTDAYYNSKSSGSGSSSDSTVKQPKKYILPTVGVMAVGENEYSEYSYNVYCDIDALIAQLKKVFKKSAIPGQPTRKNGKAYSEVFYSQLKVQVDDMENVSEITKTINAMGYSAYSSSEWIQSEMNTMNTIQAVLGAIGAVAMLVAAISITNTMMMSIYERTKEIGVMKVLGCDIRNIQALFLLEAGFIGFIGGVLGVGFSYILSFVINYFVASSNMIDSMGMGISGDICRIPLWLCPVAIAFAVVVGMVAGFIPSLRAMKLSPLAAIRNE